MRKFSAYTGAISLPLYAISMFFIADMCLHIINFTNFAWLGFLILGSGLLIGLIIFVFNLSMFLGLWNTRRYAKQHQVSLPWYLYWGVPKEEIEAAVNEQQKLLTQSNDMVYTPVDKSEDIKHQIQTYRRK